MKKIEVPKKKPKPPDNDDQTAEEYFAEIDRQFEKYISELAALLGWKKETVAGIIFQSLDLWYWRGKTPVEIAAQQHHFQTYFGYMELRHRREVFLGNAGYDDEKEF